MQKRWRLIPFLIFSFILITLQLPYLTGATTPTQTEVSPSEAREEYEYEYEYDDEEDAAANTDHIMDSLPDIPEPVNNLDEQSAHAVGTTRKEGLLDDISNFLQPISESNDVSNVQLQVERPKEPPEPMVVEVKEPIELQMPLDELVKVDKRGAAAGQGAKPIDTVVEPVNVVGNQTGGVNLTMTSSELPPREHARPPPAKDNNYEPYDPSGIEDAEAEAGESQATIIETYKHGSFYTNCQDEKRCLGDHQNCTAQKLCEVAVSYEPKPESGGVLIELLGKTIKYVALGLSTDPKMGDDNVIECVRENDQVRIHRSVNQGHTNTRLKDRSALSQMKGHFEDDWLYCSFLLRRLTKVQTSASTMLTFDLEKLSYYIFLARGNAVRFGANQDGIGYHDLGKTVSQEKHNLMAYGETSLRRLFVRLHGICILIAWILVLPISTFVMRYFKNTCNDRFVGNLSLWFAVHVILNGVVLGLTVAAILIIMIPTRGHVIGSAGWTLHNISAIIITLLVFVQVFLGIKIYGERHFSHTNLSRFHAILGHAIFLFSFFIIWKSRHVRHGLPCATLPVLVAWIVIYFVIHLIISYQVCYVDFINGAQSSRIYRFTGLPPAPVADVNAEPSGGIVRKVLLWALTGICVVSTGIMLGMYGYGLPDCIREAENNYKS